MRTLVNFRFWPTLVVCTSWDPTRQKFESPALKTRMVARFPQKLLTFSAKYGYERASKSA
jgi:hypothetical protein